jgi:hypothetical protein
LEDEEFGFDDRLTVATDDDGDEDCLELLVVVADDDGDEHLAGAISEGSGDLDLD